MMALSVKFTDLELKLLSRLAAEAGLTPEEYVHNAVLIAAVAATGAPLR